MVPIPIRNPTSMSIHSPYITNILQLNKAQSQVRHRNPGISIVKPGEQVAAAGEEFKKKSDQAGGAQAVGKARVAGVAAGGDFVNLDFLAQASAVLVNLTADEKGIVSIPRQELGPHQHLHIVAIDPAGHGLSFHLTAGAKGGVCDLRLANGVGPEAELRPAETDQCG